MEIPPGTRIGVALGGGAARGLAHIGVLKALEDARVPVHALAGVSAGAIVAAAYAAGLSIGRLLEEAQRITWRDIGGFSLSMRGLHRNDRMEAWLERVLPVRTFEELPLKLRLVATDLRTGAARILERGPLFPAIRASCAIPGLYVPVELDGELLADGYLSCNLPARQLRELGVDVVIGSSIGLEISSKVRLDNAYQILMRSFSIMSETMQHSDHRDADVVIEPPVRAFGWSEMSAATQLVDAGERATRAQLQAIAAALQPTWRRRLRSALRDRLA